MATALLGYYHRIRIGHVEAGLRTSDKWQPFPEEINRRVAGVVSDLHFAPTDWSRDNLLKEGVHPASIIVTGNPVIDALLMVVKQPFDLYAGPLQGIHRRENFGAPLKRVFTALAKIAQEFIDDCVLVYPVHLNPNVRSPAYEMLGQIPNILLVDPLDYLPMVHLMERAHLVLTDSGGLQEEAPALGTPVLVLREVTERPEAIEAGTARLVGTNQDKIVEQTRLLLNDPEEHSSMAKAINPYGDGHAADRIVEALLSFNREG
jgi:UDP-N-acetylglucosamine 2-epimerase (non-hydrolysing)